MNSRKRKRYFIPVLAVIIVLAAAYYVQPWMAYFFSYSDSPYWTPENLRERVNNGAYWEESQERGLLIDKTGLDPELQTVYLNKKVQRLDTGLYLLRCDGVTNWGTFFILYNRIPFSRSETDFSWNCKLSIKGSENNSYITKSNCSSPIKQYLGYVAFVMVPSPTELTGNSITLILEYNGKVSETEVTLNTL